MGGGLLEANNQIKRKIKLIGLLILVLSPLNIRALTSDNITYENEGVTESLTSAIDKLYSELKEYKTNGSVTSTEMLEGYTGYAKGKLVSGSIKKKGSTTYTPGINNQIISRGQYLDEDQVILGDRDLVAENIKGGVELFGVIGSIKDNSGKTVEATNITSDDTYTYLNVPEGIYTNTSKVKTKNSELNNHLNQIQEINDFKFTNQKIITLNFNPDFLVVYVKSDAYNNAFPAIFYDNKIRITNGDVINIKELKNNILTLTTNNTNWTYSLLAYKNY